MTNKTKAVIWTSILLITLTFLSVLTVLFTKAFLLLLLLGLFGVAISLLYHIILEHLGDE
jgi:hypothetical protein